MPPRPSRPTSAQFCFMPAAPVRSGADWNWLAPSARRRGCWRRGVCGFWRSIPPRRRSRKPRGARSAHRNVTLRQALLPQQMPRGPFDLIVASEILYYLRPNDLRSLISRTTGDAGAGRKGGDPASSEGFQRCGGAPAVRPTVRGRSVSSPHVARMPGQCRAFPGSGSCKEVAAFGAGCRKETVEPDQPATSLES